jgi:hypothetical protein
MVTYQQFENAIEVVIDYMSQLENEIQAGQKKQNFVNIQNKISKNTFWVLKNYYDNTYKINLEWDDLIHMNLDKLKLLDFETLRTYRGFGLKSEMILKQLLNPYINDCDEKLKLNEPL